MKLAWIAALRRRFTQIYGTKFTALFQDGEAIDDWYKTWAEYLGEFSGEAIAFALKRAIDECPWPPTMHEFRAFCKAAPKPVQPVQLEAPSTPSPEARAKLKEALGQIATAPMRPPGLWWAEDIMAKVERGEYVGFRARELAQEALDARRAREQPERAPAEPVVEPTAF